MPAPWQRISLAGAVGCFGLCMFGCGFGFGVVYSELSTYARQYGKERELIDPTLASDPAFANLQCNQRSNGGVSLSGTVPTWDDRDRLRERLTRLVGEGRGSEIVRTVHVARE